MAQPLSLRASTVQSCWFFSRWLEQPQLLQKSLEAELLPREQQQQQRHEPLEDGEVDPEQALPAATAVDPRVPVRYRKEQPSVRDNASEHVDRLPTPRAVRVPEFPGRKAPSRSERPPPTRELHSISQERRTSACRRQPHLKRPAQAHVRHTGRDTPHQTALCRVLAPATERCS